MATELDRIRAKCTPAERDELDVLATAVERTLAAYQKHYAESDLKKWTAAKAALAEFTAALEAKYFPSERCFPHRKAACDWLKDQGYKIGKSKFYADCDNDLCVVEGDGTVRESALIAYVSKNDIRRITDENGNLTPLIEEKVRLETRKLEIQIEKAMFEFEKDQKKYIKRSDHERMMATVFGALDQLGQNFIRSEAPDVFSKIGGDQKKTTMGLELMLAGWDNLMREVSDPHRWDITIEEDAA